MRRITLLILVAAGVLRFAPRQTLLAEQTEPIKPIPRAANLDVHRVALGARLFADVRLSRDERSSCSSCHPLSRAGMDGVALAPRPSGTPGIRNTPTIFNVGFSPTLNWDGLANTLERHAELLLQEGGLMGVTWPEVLSRLGRDSSYVSGFKAAYPPGLTRFSVVDAIANFERSLLTPNSRFDLYLRGERTALSTQEQEGYRFFKAYGCVSCHQGVNMGGNLYQKFGIFEEMIPGSRAQEDEGRFRITKVPRDRYVFRVPSLRNVALTSPYFHDGRESSLKGAVETMAKAQLGRKLETNEIARLVDFLQTLTGEYRGKMLTAASEERR